MANTTDGATETGQEAGLDVAPGVSPGQGWDETNPFFARSTLPFGAPPFDRIADEHYMPALLAGMRAQVLEVQSIVACVEAPTFDNTVAALERSGTLLTRVASVFFCVAGAETNERIQAIQQDVAPLFSAHSDSIYLHGDLFQRVHAVYEQRAALALGEEAERLLQETHDQFVRAGALLDENGKAAMRALNAEQASLQAAFVNKVLTGSRNAALHVQRKEELNGLSEAECASARAAAEQRGVDGYVLPILNTTQQPLLASLAEAGTRQSLWRSSLTRTELGDENDTRADVVRLAQLRAERAALLGYASYATWKLENQMARTPEAAIAFLDGLVPAAHRGLESESAAIAEYFSLGGAVPPQDWSYYAEQVRKAQYDLNQEEVKPYFELTRVFEQGVLFAASELYGIRFERRIDLPVWHGDVTTYEIFDADGSHLALLYTDFYKRDTKRGGAWMNSLVTQSRLLGEQPVICNVCNYTKPVEGEPALLTSDEVATLFHEFGHALHGLFSDVEYPSLAGTAVPRDFVGGAWWVDQEQWRPFATDGVVARQYCGPGCDVSRVAGLRARDWTDAAWTRHCRRCTRRQHGRS